MRAIEAAASERFKKSAHRSIAFAQPGGVCAEPIFYDEALAAGKIGVDEDRFTLLPGDVVTTQAA